jgi:hypothetical protein
VVIKLDPLLNPVLDCSNLVSNYCMQVNNNIFILLFFIFLMWLFEPAIIKVFSKIKYKSELQEYLYGPENLKLMYKWIGLGLIFMLGYLLWIMGGG